MAMAIMNIKKKKITVQNSCPKTTYGLSFGD